MAVVTVSHTRNGKALLNYVLHSKPHHPDKYVQNRNMYVSAIDCPITDIDDAMAALWKNTNCKNQLFSVVQSFRDLDYRNLDNVKAVHEAGLKLVKQLLAKLDVKRQVIVATQCDGAHHLIHNHILINNCGEDGRGIPHGIYSGKVMDINDQIVKSMNTPENDVQDELIEQKERWHSGDYRHSYEPVTGVSKKDKRYNLSKIGLGINDDLKNKHHYRTNKHEKLVNQDNNKYIIQVVTDALAVAQSKQQFIQILNRHDVKIKIRKRQKNINWHAKNLSFVHEGHKRSIRSTTINKEWTADFIKQQFERNRVADFKRQQEQEIRDRQIAQDLIRWQKEQEQKEKELQKMRQAKEDHKSNTGQPTSPTIPKLEKETTPLQPTSIDWPTPVNLTRDMNGCFDFDTIQEDPNVWTKDNSKFERKVEKYRNKCAVKYHNFTEQQRQHISFREFFVLSLAAYKKRSVIKFLKSLIKTEAEKLMSRLNKVIHSYKSRMDRNSSGAGEHVKELLERQFSEATSDH